MDYVQFQLPDSDEGTLYYNYTSGGDYDSRVTESRSYYRNRSPYLRRVTFVADDGFTGTVEFGFTAWSTRGDRFTGTVEIAVGRTGDGDIRYTCRADGQADFDDNDFNDLCRDLTGESLSYVRFDLPSTSEGRLYYDYEGNSENRVTATRSYYRSSSPYLDRVSFVPASRGRKRGSASTVLCGRLTNASHCSEGPNNGKGRRTGSNAATSTRAADE